MKKQFKDVPEANIFFYEGSTYCKVTDDDRLADCFMVCGFMENNKAFDIKKDTIVEDNGYEINQYLQGRSKCTTK